MRKFKNILVTGADGFIGWNFVNQLIDRQEELGFEKIITLDNQSVGSTNNLMLADISSDPKYKCIANYDYDICNQEDVEHIFKNWDIHCVVHFAAESHVDRSIEDPNGFIKTNVLGTTNLLNICRKYWKGCQSRLFHHVSTDEVFGEANGSKFKEKSMYNPRSPYSASKAASDHIVRSFFHTYGLNITISNCGNNYGPWQHKEKLIPKAIDCLDKDQKVPIYGDGKQVRNWIYVTDHCDAVIEIIYNGAIGETYLVGTTDAKENTEVIKTLITEMDKSFDLMSFVKDRPGHDQIYDIDSSKIRKELKWKPKVTFNEGIQLTINHYLNKETENE